MILIGSTLLSCSDISSGISSDNEETVFTLPEWDENLPELDYWIVKTFSADGMQETTVNGEKKNFSLTLPKDFTASVTAQPVFIKDGENYDFFKPAGCIYPLNTTLSWEEGFSAAILFSLYTSASCSNSESGEQTAYYLSEFNWDRFISTIHEKANEEAELFYNPWNLDKEEILNDIASGEFSVYDLSAKNRKEFSAQQIFEYAGGAEDAYIPGILLSSYIPENTDISETDSITLCAGTTEPAEFMIEESVFLYISLSDTETISSAVFSL